ncbi:MAG: type I restriction enzyme HsdR N-terminal domain-containing protein [Bdellovibrionales bacterium]|jgi:hypothetical protein|nr:type I restriction enzyme HsdR N-terminal domain-containing protein [Bdellovibrionales bacterium]
MNLPVKAAERVRNALKRFQPIIQSAKSRDVNESDTVVIVTDMLEYIFGYDKYTEITSEHAIRGTFCDLAVKLDGNVAFLAEIKAIGLELKEQHIKQAVDYAANQGVEWVCLTNGDEWRVYKLSFGKPINSELVVRFNLLALNSKNAADIDMLGLLAKEGWQKARLEQHHSVQQIVNKFTIGAVLLSEPVVSVVRRELRRLSAAVKVDDDEIKRYLKNDVIKREVLEGDKAVVARKQVAKAEKKALRKARENSPAGKIPANETEDQEQEVLQQNAGL